MTTETNITEIYINGVQDGYNGRCSKKEWNQISSLKFSFSDKKSAEQFASYFPKYCKALVGKIGHPLEGITRDTVSLSIDVNRADGVTGSKNEAAEKRKSKVYKILEIEGLLDIIIL